jgi:hypothetical protein
MWFQNTKELIMWVLIHMTFIILGFLVKIYIYIQPLQITSQITLILKMLIFFPCTFVKALKGGWYLHQLPIYWRQSSLNEDYLASTDKYGRQAFPSPSRPEQSIKVMALSVNWKAHSRKYNNEFTPLFLGGPPMVLTIGQTSTKVCWS